MRIRVLGGGLYGCHLALAMLEAGHDVEVHEIRDRLFDGASGSIPARLHQGQHYPRSHATRKACQEHRAEFMERYGHLTRGVPVNIYAVAAHDSLVDFGTYCQVLRDEIEFITIDKPEEYGLQNVEGAILTGERHLIVDKARDYFTDALNGRVKYGVSPVVVDDPRWDLTLDCTFCANDEQNIDRFEPCLTVLLHGPTDRAVTIMDGGFGSLYPWNEERGLSSLTSASLTPISKTCKSWAEAKAVLDAQRFCDLGQRAELMREQMAQFWPASGDWYRFAEFKLSIRAMPRSAADARLVDVIRVGDRALRVRAGKIDAVFHAERIIKALIREWRRDINKAVVA